MFVRLAPESEDFTTALKIGIIWFDPFFFFGRDQILFTRHCFFWFFRNLRFERLPVQDGFSLFRNRGLTCSRTSAELQRSCDCWRLKLKSLGLTNALGWLWLFWTRLTGGLNHNYSKLLRKLLSLLPTKLVRKKLVS